MSITADVRVSEYFDRIVVTPRNPVDSHTLTKTLKRVLPEVKLHTSVAGVHVGALDADLLLGTDQHVDLRWSPEALVFAQNRQRAKRVHPVLLSEVNKIRSGGRKVAEEYLSQIEGLDILDDHQWVNVAAMTLPFSHGLCVFDEQGVGKTVTLIFAYDVLVLRDQVDFALIVAPKSMISEWVNDFKRFMGDLYKVRTLSGTHHEKVTSLASGADVLVTNYETAVSMEPELRALLRGQNGRAMLVIDESFYVKNLDAKRTRALRRLREWCGRAFVLCGTPAPNSPHDLVQQSNIVDFGLTFEGMDIPKDRDAARTVVKDALEKTGLFVRHLKYEALPSLPAKRFHRIIMALEPKQERLYRAALRSLVLDLRSVSDEQFQRNLGSFLARRSALLQICSNPISLVNGYDEAPAKLKALDSILEGLIGRKGEKVVVWSFYTASINAIFSRYRRFNPVRFDGTVSTVAERGEAVRRFQDDDVTMLFVGNPAAAGAGLNLHRACFAVYESMSNQAAHYLQSLDRIHRRGQTRGVEYIILLCDRTIELTEYEHLIKKENSAHLLLGDTVVQPLTREYMLSEVTEAAQLIGEEV